MVAGGRRSDPRKSEMTVLAHPGRAPDGSPAGCQKIVLALCHPARVAFHAPMPVRGSPFGRHPGSFYDASGVEAECPFDDLNLRVAQKVSEVVVQDDVATLAWTAGNAAL
jgi:hypothetical protein